MLWTRTLLGLAASLASFAAGASISDDSPAEGEAGRAPLPRLESAGYAASGPSFYVWEEDSRQGRRWATELSRQPRSSIEPSGSPEPSGSGQPAT
jgi:hypothetical protein